MTEPLDHQSTGYFVEEYESVEKLLCERGWTLEECLERINDPQHIIKDFPVVVYENPDLSIFKLGYLEEGLTPLNVLDGLKRSII
ncbi:hypothetical protein ACFOLA_03060 [Salinicoccus hispanicus]|uniref:Uncharacterized protein n=1 Tax=Salinicoccus hispanicus TaxID=157225 RepID=A0A6N8TX89_9STAP|nr:hypothetical protein [Salinicoccus hispanicus]MXQ50558.1 hypothetical protein [Salinicoccus hispanicus]